MEIKKSRDLIKQVVVVLINDSLGDSAGHQRKISTPLDYLVFVRSIPLEVAGNQCFTGWFMIHIRGRIRQTFMVLNNENSS